MINNEKRELTLIYHSSKVDDKKARAFVESLNGYAIKTLDLAREKVTATQLVEIANKMDQATVKDLMDYTYAASVNGEHKKDFQAMDEQELLTVLVANPELIATPLLIIGQKAYHYDSAYNLVRKDLDHMGGGHLETANEEETSKDKRP